MSDVRHFEAERVLDQAVELFWRRGAALAGISEVVAVTGLSRSSLYATFGGKQELYVAALRRYVDHRSRPVLDALAADDAGLPAIAAFFDGLIRARCEGEHARWGCMVANAHSADGDAQVREVLDEHHTRLRSALAAACSRSQLRPGLEPEAVADMLALLAYGVNLRSRAGASAAHLRATVTVALESLGTPRNLDKERQTNA